MQFTKTTLPNGLRVIFVPQKESLATTVMVLVQAGSKYETKDRSGISHFLEHLCFKGTKRRPTALHIASELDGLGAQYNAFTSHEYTGYYAKVKNEFFSRALDVIADLYLNPVFEAGELEKEKGVIVEEINMYEDLPTHKIQDLFMELVYGDQPAGWPITGRKEVVRALRREDFVRYRGAHYVPHATAVIVAGGVDESRTLSEIERYFRVFDVGDKDDKPAVLETQDEPRELIYHKESDQTHLILGFRAFGLFDERKYALQALTDILGGGMSSRLFQKVREELGAAYYVRASDELFTDHGLLTVSAGVQHEKLDTVLRAVLSECSRLVSERVSLEELQRAKDHLTGGLILSLETSDELTSFYGGQEIVGLPLAEPEEIVQRVQRVTPEEVQAVARDIIRNDRLNLALLGPFRDKTFRDILSV